MDPAIVRTIHDAFKKALAAPETLDVLANFDMTVSCKSSEDYRKYISEAIRSEKEILDGIGLARKD